MSRKILFIHAINPERFIEVAQPPLGLGYLISSIRERFGQDYYEFKIVDKDIEKEIANYQPELVGISCVSQNYNKAKEAARIAKIFGIPVIIGGVHISMLPNSLTHDIDVGVIGEGEETICELMEVFNARSCFPADKLAGIDGLVYWKNNELVVTEKRKLIKPLDRIPLPAREYFTIQESCSIFSSRGCPYDCSFCSSTRFWEGTRFFSAEYVVNEIKFLIREYNVRVIQFWDDLFIADRKRLRKIVELLEAEKIIDRLSFSCAARSNLVDDELGQLLKKMHVPAVAMGMESACASSLAYLKGGNINPANHTHAIDILKKYGIERNASFVIGSPHETKEDILETYRFIKKSKLTMFDVYVLTPYPGTPVWDYALKRGLVSEDMNWDILDVNFGWNHENAVILSEKLSREELYHLFLQFAKEKRKKILLNVLRHPLALMLNPRTILSAITRLIRGKPLIEGER